MKSKAVLISTAVSFIVIIVALAVSAGFRKQIRSGVADLCGDLRIVPACGLSEVAGLPVDTSMPVFDAIRSIQGVRELRPVIYRGGIARGQEDMHGVIFRSDASFCKADTAVVIPDKLASLLRLSPGDRMLSYFIGESLSVRKFEVSDSYDALVTADDKLVVQCSPEVLRSLNGWKANEVSAVEIVLTDDCLDDASLQRVKGEIDALLSYINTGAADDLRCENIHEEYSQLFDWLNLIDGNVRFILILMIIVAAFNMITGLLIFLFENTSTIGLLKSLGMNSGRISRIFLLSSARSVLAGMLAGNLLAMVFCIVQQRFKFLTLNPDNYFVSFVPVSLDFTLIAICDFVAFILIMLSLLIPCSFISRVDPSVTLRRD